MANKIYRILTFLLIFTLVSCTGNDIQEACLNDDLAPAPGSTRLTGWDLSSDNSSPEFNQPSEQPGDGGVVEMGARGNLLGATGTKAINNFDCGDGNKCKIQVNVGTFDERENEKVHVTITKGTTSYYDETFGNLAGPQVQITVPTCKGLKVSLKLTEGNNPGIKSKVRASVITQCLDC